MARGFIGTHGEERAFNKIEKSFNRNNKEEVIDSLENQLNRFKNDSFSFLYPDYATWEKEVDNTMTLKFKRFLFKYGSPNREIINYLKELHNNKTNAPEAAKKIHAKLQES